MDRPQLIPSVEDDLYAGFNDFHPSLQTANLIQEPPRNLQVHSRGSVPSRGAATSTGRPLTAVRGAGYTSNRLPTSVTGVDAVTSSSRIGVADTKAADTPEKQIKLLEAAVTQLVNESILCHSRGESRPALDKAKEASLKERNLQRQRDQTTLDANNDLTLLVQFNLANQLANSGLYTDALMNYQLMIKNRYFSNVGRLRLNIANLHFEMGQYAQALKQYRMALDQVPSHFVSLRVKIMQNIGLLFIKMGQYNDACTSFEFIMQEKADFKTGLHLVLSYYALADRENMQKAFLRMLDVVPDVEDSEKLFPGHDDDGRWSMLKQAVNNDPLHRLERQARMESERSILMAAKLISPVIEDSFADGYQWCLEAIKESVHSHLADDLEINKAVLQLRQRDVAQAAQTLLNFEKRSSKMATNAAINLSTVFYLQGDFGQAEKYAQVAHDSDPYNAAAFVCLGNCALKRADYDKARKAFSQAIDNDATCIEALYNLGLTLRQMGDYGKAMECFLKVQTVLRHQPEVLCQIGNLHERLANTDQSIEWYLQVHTVVPSDAGILHKLGQSFDRLGDRQQAFHYFSDSYRHYPCDLDTIRWLAAYYMELQVTEKAVTLYEKACQLRPSDPQWPLAVISCTQRSGNYHKSLQLLKAAHFKFPDNADFLRLLARLGADLGLKEAAQYANQLRKLENNGSRIKGQVIEANPPRLPTSPTPPPPPPLSLSSLQSISALDQHEQAPRLKTARRLANDSETIDVDIGEDLLPL